MPLIKETINSTITVLLQEWLWTNWKKPRHFYAKAEGAYLESSTRRVSGVLGIPVSNVVGHLHDLGKTTQSSRIVLHVQPKYCKTFDSLSIDVK